MTIREMRKKAKENLRYNYLLCVAAALIMALVVEGSQSIGSTLPMLETEQISSIEGSESADGGETVTETAEAADSVQASMPEGTELPAFMQKMSTTQMAFFIAGVRQFFIFLGNYLPSSIGMFLNMTLFGPGMLAMPIVLFFSNMVEVGVWRFYLVNSVKKAYINELFYSFKKGRYYRIFMIQLYRMAYIMLWGFLFIIPGAIKAYEYRLVPYLLAESVDYKIPEILQKSKDMMNGHKKEAFLLDLSFVGWDILGVLTLGMISTFWGNPYKCMSRAEFYMNLRGPIDGSKSYGYTERRQKSAFDSYHKYQKKMK